VPAQQDLAHRNSAHEFPLAPAADAKKKKNRRRLLKAVEVRNISVDIRNVLDPTIPGEDIWLFRLANRLHIPTARR